MSLIGVESNSSVHAVVPVTLEKTVLWSFIPVDMRCLKVGSLITCSGSLSNSVLNLNAKKLWIPWIVMED